METRYCPRCAKNLLVTEFKKTKNGKFQSYCMPCRRDYKREAYKKNPEKTKASSKKWTENNKERYKGTQAKYRKKNREKLRLGAVEYRKKHKEEINARNRIRIKSDHSKKVRQLYILNRKKNDQKFISQLRASGRKAGKKYYWKNKNSILEICKKNYSDNPEKYRKKSKNSVKKWRHDHPEKVRLINSRVRAIRRGARIEIFNETNHIQHLLNWQLSCCYYCNTSIESGYHVDHIIPIVKGGKHCRQNLILACPSCNMRKNDRLLGLEWTAPINKINYYNLSVEAPIHLLSTFLLSKRNCENSTLVLEELKSTNKLIIFDWEWNSRRTSVNNILLNKLGESNKIFARKTEVNEIDSSDAQNFLNTYHIQGFGRGSLYLGIIYNNELIGVSSWLENNGLIELNRLAFNGTVVGGFSKLLKTFITYYLPSNMKIISFVDRRYANGHSYEKLGFKYIGDTLSPLYYYINGTGMYHRRLFTKDNIKKYLSYFNPNLTEAQNAEVNGYYQLKGLTQKKYIYTT